MTVTAKKILSWSLKAAILALAAWFIYHKLANKNSDLDHFKHFIANLDRTQVTFTISAVAVLMLLNWFLEALKWQYVTRKLIDISRWKAIESVFCGLTWAIITPNRVGEYGGRIMFLPNRKRIHGLFAMIVGGLGQNLVTNILGLIGVLWFIHTYVRDKIGDLYFWCIVVFVAAFLFLLNLFYFNIDLMVRVLNRVKFIRKYQRFFGIMARYHTTELLNILWYSTGRFAVFTLQYYLLIHLLVPQLSLLTIVMTVFTFLLIQSALPSLDIFDIGVRSFTAANLFAYVTTHQIAVVVCVSLIWLINLIIPAVIGCLFVFKLKFFDRDA
ncbi:hypothetical protein EOD41_04460 [Mucilaginibacter limnophilus]|uniref:Flippase-like domain-containing protein n=1 Tax=Mucilaginibacter limnophilus TaxID=1932778 RepID=A0A437MU78_9SPHI|nr:lysylphosphatidylglycerol synthase domain-containing protein [Mucilaginibacter limnophilus]RVU01224.1 hypothetical protein EOD41_04460 [Mucilaginibacter limnophilus]